MDVQNITTISQPSSGISPDGQSPAVSSQQVVATTSRQTVSASLSTPAAKDYYASGNNVSVTINWSAPLFHKINEGKTTLNSAAEAVKQSNSALNSAGQIIGKMKLQLDGIVKNNPPFPPGDTQRMKYLEGFMSLRQQIEQLTFPSDKIKPAIAIPALPTNPANDTSNAPIHEAIAALSSAADTINAWQQGLSSGFQTTLTGETPAQSGGTATTPMSEYSANQNSQSIQVALATTPSGLSSKDSSLLKTL